MNFCKWEMEIDEGHEFLGWFMNFWNFGMEIDDGS
jgi:hypothetical protein